MKRITLFLTFCLCLNPIFSQLDFGIKAGLNLTNISGEILTADYHISPSPGSNLGYHAGAFLRASLFGIFIQPELLVTSIASEYTVTDQKTNIEQLGKQRIGRVDMPIIIGAKLGTLRLGVGPVGSIIVSNKSDLSDYTGYESELKSATIGYQLGAGIDIWKICIDIRYEGGLSKLGDQIIVGGGVPPINTDSRAKQLIFSLGYRF